MKNVQGFRCPFEIKGEKDGSILNVALCEDRTDRMKYMREALKRFHSDLSLLALKMRLPDSLQDVCSTNKDLQPKIVPIQCELLTVELELRLNPFLPHQMPVGKLLRNEKDRFMHLMTASALAESYCAALKKMPRNADDITDWIEKGMRAALDRGVKRPTFKISGSINIQNSTIIDLLEIHLSAAVILADRSFGGGDPKINQNLYSLVMTPFYPESFGRYSPDIQIMITREANFDNLTAESRVRMRRASNTVLRDAGVLIKSLDDDKQDSGLWFPRYRLDRKRPSS